MRMITSLSAVALAAAATAPAWAQDGTFTGPRVELFGGYDNVQAGDDDSDEAAEGVVYGVGLGYDVQLGSAVVGLEGEYAGSSANLTGSDIDIAGDSFRLEADRDLYVGARVGFAVAPTTLVYAKGGYTNFKVSSRYEDGTGGTFDQGVTADGWRAGVGIEQKLTGLSPNAYVKAEYRYSHYSNLDLDDVDADIDTDRHQIMAGIGIRF